MAKRSLLLVTAVVVSLFTTLCTGGSSLGAPICATENFIIPIQFEWQFKKFSWTKGTHEGKDAYRLHFYQCNADDCLTETIPSKLYCAMGIEPQYVEIIWLVEPGGDVPYAWEFAKSCKDKIQPFYLCFDSKKIVYEKNHLVGAGVTNCGKLCSPSPCSWDPVE